MTEKLPWLKFWPADYLRDVAHLSLAARGAWMDLICRMHSSANPGVIRGDIPTLARCLGVDAAQLEAVLDELGSADNPTGAAVADITRQGAKLEIRCRRMIRDAETRETARKNGQKGGNPALRRRLDQQAAGAAGDNRGDNREDNHQDNGGPCEADKPRGKRQEARG